MAPKPKDRGKSSAPASQPPPPAIEDLFTTLNKHIQQDSHYEQAVKVANQVLASAPGDEDALRCKVVALIKIENFDEALSTIQSARKLPIDFSFFKAYCLYKVNKLDEALESLKDQERNSGTMLLESQILFRLKKWDAGVDLYQKLQKSKIKSLETNLVAGLVLGGRASEVQGMEASQIKASRDFELAYNIACSLIEKKMYTDAEQLLVTAQRVGQEDLMNDDWADDAIENELARISVQLAYTQQLSGRSQEAMRAYTDIINKNLEDELSSAVAVNNLVALKGTRDVSDNLRKLDRLKAKDAQGFQLSDALEKLSPRQREAIYVNRVLLLLHANKMDQAREIVAALPNMFADSVAPVLLQAAVLVRENKAGKAEEILGQFVEKFPEKSKIILLARAQVAAAAGHPQVAADSLAKITDIQHMPATVATIVALKERAGDIDGASAVLDSAIKWWPNAMSEDNKLDLIMQEAASFNIRHGREEEAAHLYEQLVKSHGTVEALAGLVCTVAHVNVDKAEAYEKQLKPLPGLKGIDADSLEKTSGAKHVEGSHMLAADVHDEGKKEKPKKKRKRKPKYPKGFDPANPGPPPDPERWLPKRERSSFRPKRKDKRAAQVRGSQGAVVREKQEAVAAAAAATSNSSSSKSGQACSSKAAAEQPKPSSKSSRKKSRK